MNLNTKLKEKQLPGLETISLVVGCAYCNNRSELYGFAREESGTPRAVFVCRVCKKEDHWCLSPKTKERDYRFLWELYERTPVLLPDFVLEDKFQRDEEE